MFRTQAPSAINLSSIIETILVYKQGTGFSMNQAQFLYDLFNLPEYHIQRNQLKMALMPQFGDAVNDHLKMVASDVLEYLWKPNNNAFLSELDEAATLRKTNMMVNEKINLQEQILTILTLQSTAKDHVIAQEEKRQDELKQEIASTQIKKNLLDNRLSASEAMQSKQTENIQSLLDENALLLNARTKNYSQKQVTMQKNDYIDLNARLSARGLQLRAAISDYKKQIIALKKKVEDFQEITTPPASLTSVAPVQHVFCHTGQPITSEQGIKAYQAWVNFANKIDETSSAVFVKDTLKKMFEALVEHIDKDTPELALYNHLLLCREFDLNPAHPLYIGLTQLLNPIFLDNSTAQESYFDCVTAEIESQKRHGLFTLNKNGESSIEKQVADCLLVILEDYTLQFDSHIEMKESLQKIESIKRCIKHCYEIDNEPVTSVQSLKMLRISKARGPATNLKAIDRLNKVLGDYPRRLALQMNRKALLIEETLETVFSNLRKDLGNQPAEVILGYFVAGCDKLDKKIAHDLMAGVTPLLSDTILKQDCIVNSIDSAMKHLKTWKGTCLSDAEFSSGKDKLDFLKMCINAYGQHFQPSSDEKIRILCIVNEHINKNMEHLAKQYDVHRPLPNKKVK